MRFTIVTTSLLAVLLLTLGCQSENAWPPNSSGDGPTDSVYGQSKPASGGCPSSWRMQGLC